MKKIIISGIILFLILAVSGCSTNNRQQNSSANSLALTTIPTTAISQADNTSQLTPTDDAKLTNPTTIPAPSYPKPTFMQLFWMMAGLSILQIIKNIQIHCQNLFQIGIS